MRENVCSNRGRRLIGATLALAALGGSAHLAFGQGTPAIPNVPVAQDPELKKRKTVEALLTQGGEALAANEYKGARDAFLDVLQLDAKQSSAMLGLGYAYLQLNDNTRARDMIERSITFSGATGTPISREQAINVAVAHLRTRNQMRAAKFIRDYMAVAKGPVDETALNALGAALMNADEQAKKNRFWADGVAFYEQMNAKLEATRPGEKRWGVQWMPAAQANQKIQAMQQAQGHANQLGQQEENAERNYARTKSAYERAVSQARFSGGDTSGARNAMAQAEQAMKLAQKAHEDAEARVPRPLFPTEMPALALDDVEFGPKVAVASADPVSPAPVIPTTPTPKPPTPVTPTPVTPTPVTPTPVTPTPVTPAPVTPTPKPPTPVTPTPPAPVQPQPEPAPVTPKPAAPKRSRVTTYAAAFPVAPDLIVTSLDAVEGANQITLQTSDGTPFTATLAASDKQSGLALLEAKGRRFVPLALGDAPAAGAATIISYPSVSVFDPAAESLSGTIATADGKWTARMTKHPRLAGGPVVAGGKVVAVELATRDAEPSAIPLATIEDIRRLMNGRTIPPAPAGNFDPASLTLQLTAVREKGR